MIHDDDQHDGGQGDDALTMPGGRQPRASMVLLERHVKTSLDLDPAWLRAAHKTALELMLKGRDERVRIRAARLLHAMDAKGADVAVQVERMALEREKLGNDPNEIEPVLRLPASGPWSAAGTHVTPEGETRAEAPPCDIEANDDAADARGS